MRKIIKFVLVAVCLLLFITLPLIEIINRTPFEETKHFRDWKEKINSYNFNSSNIDSVKVGWALENITPDFSAPIAGYGKRKGIHFSNVHDSIYVRSIAVETSNKTVYLVSADLLFIPPKVVENLKLKLENKNIHLKDIHFSATHSHSSLGGWESSLLGFLFGGKYDEKIVEFLAEKFEKAILMSKNNLSPGNVSYSEIVDEDDVRYRLKLENGVRDTELRSLTFEKNTGEKAFLLTYSAHNTTLGDKNIELSRDYSGFLVDGLLPHFGIYMSGAVASMGPIERGITEFDEAKNQAQSILYYFNQRKEEPLKGTLVSELIKVPMPDASARITKNLALRDWVFKALFGDYDTYIKVTKIGNTLILGMPADFSGEIMVELDAYAKSKGLNLIITSFNGGYIGYITHDRIYDSGLYETVTMSWFGYQMGGYFSQISKDIIDKLAI